MRGKDGDDELQSSGVQQMFLDTRPPGGALNEHGHSPVQGCSYSSCPQEYTFGFAPTSADTGRTPRRFVPRVKDQVGFETSFEPFDVLFDNDAPTLDEPAGKPDPNRWYKDEQSFSTTLTGRDTGSGVKLLRLSTPRTDGSEDVQQEDDPSCSDALTNLCQTDPPSTTFNYSTTGMPEGASNRVTAVAEDAVTNKSVVRDWPVKVDRTKPTQTVAWDPPLPAGEQLWEDEYKATVTASDGGSGIQRAELLIDGERIRDDHLYERTSACDGCGLTHTFTLRTQDLTPGPHTITIGVRDFATNDSVPDTSSVTYALGGGDLPEYSFDKFTGSDDTDLRVNLGNGNLLVSSHDVRDTEMGVDRYYNSTWSGRRGSTGKGWTTGIGADIRLREARDGSILFYGPSNYAVRFTRNSDGTYVPPSLFVGSLVRRSDGRYVVTDTASGEMFEFTSANSNLVRVTDGTDFVDVSYASDGSIDRLIDFDERTTSFATSAGRITSITDDDAEIAHTYGYDVAGRLTTSTSPETGTTAYEYDSSERLRLMTLPSGVRFEITYDGSSSRVATVTQYPSGSVAGATTTYTYQGDTTTVARPTGVAVYRHDTNLQVYTSDTEAPDVYQPFGDDADATQAVADGGYTNGMGTIDLDVIADDSGSGVREIQLEQIGVGTVATRTTTCAQLPGNVGFVSVCPPRYVTAIPLDVSSLPSGATKFRLHGTDGAGNTVANPEFEVLVDRTAPPAPSSVRLFELDDAQHKAEFEWEYGGDDPDLFAAHEGAGLGAASYRYKLAGTSTWSAWTDADDADDFGTIGGADTGEVFDVEVRVADAVGNLSPALASTLTIAEPAADPSEEFGTLPSGTSTIEVEATLTAQGETDAEDTTEEAYLSEVAVTHTGSGQRAVRLTGEDGVASFPNIAAGDYQVELLDDPTTARSTSVAAGSTKRESTHTELSAAYTATREELRFCAALPRFCKAFKADARKAERMAELNFTGPAGAVSDGTKTNAFQHSVWLAFMVRSILYKPDDGLQDDRVGAAFEFARRHESVQRKKRPRNSKMDFHNNGVGYRSGVRSQRKKKPWNDEHLCNHMRKRILTGRWAKFRHSRNALKPLWSLRSKPRRNQLVWIQRKFRDSNDRPFRTPSTRCNR